MYILVKLERRAATTDTLLYFVSDSQTALEEIILSLYDELIEQNFDKQDIKKYLDTFYIVNAPFLKG